MKDHTMTAPEQPTYWPPTQNPPPRKRRLGPVLLGIAALVAVIMVSVGTTIYLLRGNKPTTAAAKPAVVAAAPKALTVTGSIRLKFGGFTWDQNSCTGKGGYDDIAVGAGVTVTDNTGAVIALGRIISALPDIPFEETTAVGCDLYFEVDKVPAGKGFYGVEVTHRGSVKFDEADLAQPLALSLG